MRIRPNIFDIICNLFSLILLIGGGIWLLLNWGDIPNAIPTHYNFSGQADSFGSKGHILFIYGLAWFCFLLITVLSLFPQTWNVGTKVTAQNAEYVYRLCYHFLNLLKLVCIALFIFLAGCMALVISPPKLFMPILLIVLLVIIIGYMILAKRKR